MAQIKVSSFKGFKAWSAFSCKAAEKAGRNSEHPNTKISHRLRNDKCVGFGAKLTLTADEEDDKSIYNNRDDAEEPAENPNHIYIVLNYSVVFASELFCCLLTTPFEEKPFAFLLYISFEVSISYRVYSRVNNY